jgi:membrane peptidoglycan carboxypeptidase
MAEPRRRGSARPDWDPARPKPAFRKRTIAGRITLALVGFVLLGLIGVTAVVAVGYTTTTRPDPNADFQTAVTNVYYNDGKARLGNFAVQNRTPISFAEMPQDIKDAVVAAENRDFWTDPGISIRGMFRAAWVILTGGEVQGGSTITQQYIKILYLNSTQTLTRKFKELFLAYKINNEMTKEQILEGYLNTIYFGRGAYGIQAAAQAYFDVDAEDLTVPQAAVLASVLNNPALLDPGADSDNVARLQQRYGYVLDSMVQTGTLTPAQAVTYKKALPAFPKIKTSERYGGPKGFLLKMVERELIAAGFSESQISGGGLNITTTFDKAAQNAAVKAAQRNTKQAAAAAKRKASGLHAAVASVEVGTGEVLALYGGPDFVTNSRNWATTPRPTASTFKTYALAAGLDDGFSLRSTFNGNTFKPEGDTTTVRNEFSNSYGSAVSLLRATADSINTAFVDLTMQIKGDGPEKIMKMAEAVGAPKGPGWDNTSRVALGTAEVSPLAQAGAYATFANGGVHVANHVVREVTDAEGNLLYESKPEENKAVSKDIARDVTYALSNVVEEGTGGTVRTLNRPVAGKTGTKDVKDDITSAWFVAYTKQISTAVMYVAGDDGTGDLDGYARPGDSTFFGGTYPAQTWVDYMQVAVEDTPVEEFDEPAWVNRDAADEEPQRSYSRPAEEPRDRETQEPSEEPEESAPPSSGPSSEPSEAEQSEPEQPEQSEPEEPEESEPEEPEPSPSRPGQPSSSPSRGGEADGDG